jgi:hypothetical protein
VESIWNNRASRFFLAMTAGVIAGMFVAFVIRQTTVSCAPSASAPPAGGMLEDLDMPPEEDAAMRYALLVQEGDWSSALDMVLWMRERLERLRASGRGEAAIAEERLQLLSRLSDRTETGNYLTPEGVEDQYIFTPGARLEILGRDSGRADLARPVAWRTWIKVEYPRRERALLDEARIPVRSLVAGVNVSEENDILKASLRGNLEIRQDSLSWDWNM